MNKSERVISVYSKIFKNIDLGMKDHNGKVQVICPFHVDTKPSAGINPSDGFFHCFTCDLTYNTLDKFLAAYYDINEYEAKKLGVALEDNVDSDDIPKSMDVDDALQVVEKLKIDMATVYKLKLFKGKREGNLFTLPVAINDIVLDTRDYAPKGTPKVLGAKGATSGLIVGYDLWAQRKDEPVLICAGEKDFIKAIDKGYNAIALTGGERALPKLFKGKFKDKNVIIFYDNDDTGKAGAIKLATFLHEAGAKSIKNITDHYSWMEDKEDLFDFFEKYGKTKQDLDAIISKTPILTDTYFQKQSRSTIPLVSLSKAKGGDNRDKLIQSDIQVHSTFTSSYSIPKAYRMIAKKDGKWVDVATWTLNGSNIHQILEMIDDEAKVSKYLPSVLKWEEGQSFAEIKDTPHKLVIDSYFTVYRATVVDFITDDMLSRKDDEGNETTEMDIFTIEDRLENGKAYNIQYKAIPHPKEKNRIVGVCMKTPTSAAGAVDEFKLSQGVIDSLEKFKGENVETLHQRFKGFAGNYIRKDLFLATDLAFHSPLMFDYYGKSTRGVIHCSIIGESRTGKSEAVQGAIKQYGMGKIVNAKLATLVALIGGSSNASGGWRTTSGIIPRNHKSLIALEELQGADGEYHKKITEVKSSGKVRIARADGELNINALVRLIEISNQKTIGGHTKKIEEYVNGIEVIRELIQANEDIARQDFFLLVPEPKKYIRRDDMSGVLEPFSKEDYHNRVLWAWSRNSNQVVIDKEVADHIWETSEKLNEAYNSHVKIFGSETDKKLARLSVALASMLVSTDDDYETIIVKKEHVDFIAKWMVSLYDNEVFKLKQFVDEERSYSIADEGSITALEDMYHSDPMIIEQLVHNSAIERSELLAVSGLDPASFNKKYNILFRWKLIKLNGRVIIPTGKFRSAYKQINKNDRVARQDVAAPQVKVDSAYLEDLF